MSVNVGTAIDAARYPAKLDLFWIAQNYHDLHDDFMGPVDIPAFNRAVYAVLKSGGEYVCSTTSHGRGRRRPSLIRSTGSSRRWSEAKWMRRDSRMSAKAGYSPTPTIPTRPGVFNPSIQGRTDQFVLRFRRPR